jgi:hypothetical protein
MGSGAKPPTPESAGAVSAQQQEYNTKAGIASQAGSNVNQNTDYGSLTYSQTGTGPDGVPLWTAKTSLSPEQKMLLDTLTGSQATLGKGVSDVLTKANYGADSAANVIGNMTEGNTKALLDKHVSYMNPYFTTQNQQLDTKLRNQGLMPSPSSDPSKPETWGPYERAMNHMLQNQNQSVTGYLSTMAPQAYNMAKDAYLTPLQMAGNAFGLTGPTNPTFQDTPDLNIQPANYTGASANYNDAMMKAYEAQKKSDQAMMSGLFGIPTGIAGGWAQSGGVQQLLGKLPSLALMSDRRFKRDIKRVGTLRDGIGIYNFRYIHGDGDEHIGVMADEVEKVIPEAVLDRNGVKYVDYSLVV